MLVHGKSEEIGGSETQGSTFQNIWVIYFIGHACNSHGPIHWIYGFDGTINLHTYPWGHAQVRSGDSSDVNRMGKESTNHAWDGGSPKQENFNTIPPGIKRTFLTRSQHAISTGINEHGVGRKDSYRDIDTRVMDDVSRQIFIGSKK